MRITLPNGDVKNYEQGVIALDVVKDISEGLARAACAARINGEVVSLTTPIKNDSDFVVLKFNDEDGANTFRHTASHIMAQAVKRIWPDAKLAIGPAIENGFYYDFDVKETFTPEDLKKIKAEMNKIVKEKLPIEQFELPRQEAIALMNDKNEPYKVELIEDLPEDTILSFYKQGEFVDLCAGPHLPDTGRVKSFELMSIAGAYWRGNENNKMLQRIYATAFDNKKALKAYLNMLEEAKKRDHRKLGRELELFTMYDEGPGFPVFLNNGIILKDILVKYWKEVHKRHGYEEVSTPIILNKSLWETSGHWGYYRENMYTTQIDEEEYAIKPMNCPGGMLAYKTKKHSYRDLPIRMGELGLVHRHEMSGALHGLMRVRSFTQDDAHIFMTREQVKDEIKGVIDLIDEIYAKFGFEYHVELSTRPEKSIGAAEDWELATESLRLALVEKNMDYVLNEGDGAFYGPKIDFHLKDCIGRTWQCGTIQLDFQLPQRFELEYTSAEDKPERPIMLHRVVYGSLERFMGILIEQYAGAFPFWLAPTQVMILSVAPEFNDYVKEVAEKLEGHGIRVETDMRYERIGFKIREAGLKKIPYQLILGEKEMQANTVSARPRGQVKNLVMSVDEFVELVVNEN